jgi:hypothetical protein
MATVPQHPQPDKPPTLLSLRATPQGTRLFRDAAEAEWHTVHTEARRQQAEREGSLAALVCNPEWRLAHDCAQRTPVRYAPGLGEETSP